MKELLGKLEEVEGHVTALVGKVRDGVATVRGDLETADQGPLNGLDTVLGEVEGVRAFLMGKLAEVEAKAASLRPE